jgi:hypothetical protein
VAIAFIKITAENYIDESNNSENYVLAFNG